MIDFDNFLQDSNKEFEKFFGKKFYKVINVLIRVLIVIGLLGSVAA